MKKISFLRNENILCFASNNYLASLFNVKLHTIYNWISNLNNLNFVRVKIVKNDKNEFIQRKIYINDIPYVINITYPIR